MCVIQRIETKFCAISKLDFTINSTLLNRIKRALQSKVLQSEIEISGHALVHMENNVIKEIKLLYKKEILQADGFHKTVSLFNTDLSLNPRILNEDGSPKLKKLSDRQIASNIAIIFSIADFWGEKPLNKDIANNEKLIERWRHITNYEKIRKRLKMGDFFLEETDFNW